MELNNTIILPGDNEALSKQLLTSLIQKEDVVTIIIFGRDDKSADAVQKADLRASATVSGISRKVAWMQNTALLDFLKTMIKPSTAFNPSSIDLTKHIGVSISMTDLLKDIVPINPVPDFMRMEIAFMQASTL